MRVRQPLDAESLVVAARNAGLLLFPPGRFYFGEPEPCFRLGFAQVDEGVLDEAVRRLEAACQSVVQNLS